MIHENQNLNYLEECIDDNKELLFSADGSIAKWVISLDKLETCLQMYVDANIEL